MMNDTQMIRIEVEPKEVVNFLSDPANLPRWAIGFAASVEQTADGWVVTTASGDRLQIELVSNESAGTVDFVMSPAPGVTVTAWSRVVPVDSASLVSFTQAQPAGLPDDVFDAQVRAVAHELVALKALLEVQCPL